MSIIVSVNDRFMHTCNSSNHSIIAVLKTHEKELCTIDDDSELLVVVKNFFASLNLPDGTTEEDYAKKFALFKQLMMSAVSYLFFLFIIVSN